MGKPYSYLLICSFLLLASCNRLNHQKTVANLHPLTEKSTVVIQKIEGNKEGYKFIDRYNIKTENVSLHSLPNNGLELNFTDASGYLEFIPGVVGLPEDWRIYENLSLMLKNISSEPINITITLKKPKNSTTNRAELSGNSKEKILMSINDLLKAQKEEKPFYPGSIKIDVSSDLNNFNVHILELALINDN